PDPCGLWPRGPFAPAPTFGARRWIRSRRDRILRRVRVPAERSASASEEGLGDLDRVEGGALPQVVAGQEQGDAVLDRGVDADAAHEGGIDAGGLERGGDLGQLDPGSLEQDAT